MANLIASDLQKLSPDSGYVQLFEIQLSDNPDTWIFLCNEYLEDITTKVTFRNKDNQNDINTYNVVPVVMEDIERSTDGPLPRPKITISNVFRTLGNDSFSGSLYIANGSSNVPFDSLVGMKVRRRITLRKYLYDQNTANPAIEYPLEEYYIDRISEQTNTTITFELVSPFDIQGVSLPRRSVISVGCSWDYQTAGSHLREYEKKGGCTWNQESKLTIDGIEYTVYLNKDDEYVFTGLTTSNFIAWAGSATIGQFITTSGTASKINSDGTITAGSTVTNYWQCLVGTSEEPSTNSSSWRRVWLAYTYSGIESASVYLESIYNNYRVYTTNEIVKGVSTPVTRLWRAKYRTQDAGSHASTPEFNRYWERADICGKRLNSCALRFGFQPGSIAGNFAIPPASPGNYPIETTNPETILPFGGFPTARSFE